MKMKLWYYAILLIVSLGGFVLEVFVIQKPDGFLGFLLCLLFVYLMIGSIIKLCKASERFKNSALALLEIVFYLP